MEGHPKHSPIRREFGLGVIGLGEGKGLVKGLSGHPELKVVSVCDKDDALASEVAARFDIPHHTPELSALLAQRAVDIVAIYTPDQLHVQHIRAALEAGKHVICTKPLVNSLTEAREVVALVDAHPSLHVMVGQSSRFFGSMRHQRRAFESGKLGDLSFVEASYVHDMRWFYENRAWARAGDFDLILACCSHPVDLARWYLGDVREVHAFADRSGTGERAGFHGDDTFVVNLRFENGRIGRVLGFYGLEQPHALRPWIEVGLYGTHGSMISSYPQLESIVKLVGETEHKETYFEETYHYFQFEGVNHHAGEFLNYTEYFAKCLVAGETPQPDARDGFKTIATLEAVRDSTKSGKTERVETLDGESR